MTVVKPVLPQSLRDLLAEVEAAGRGKVITQFSNPYFEIEKDWIEALRRSKENEASPHVQAMVVLIDEIDRLKKKLTRSEERRHELEQLIDADPLCPVLNRRAFERELGRAISLAGRTSDSGSVLFLDLNGLKAINDTYGHAVGDRAIERAAKMLVLSCRTTDLIGRLGGDEFAVIMPHTPPSGADVRGQRVAQLLQQVPLILDNGFQNIALSAAFGVAPFKGGDSVAGVLSAADAAMYQHKQTIKQKQTP